MEGRRGEEKWKDVVKKRRQERKDVMEGAKEERKKSCFCKLIVGAEPGVTRVEERWSEGGREEAVRMTRSTEAGEALRLMGDSWTQRGRSGVSNSSPVQRSHMSTPQLQLVLPPFQTKRNAPSISRWEGAGLNVSILPSCV